MKNLFKVTLLGLGMLSLFSCNKEDELKNQEPTAPGITVPADKAADITTDITLKWNASIDPEKGAVKYAVYIGSTEELTDDDIAASEIVETEFKASLKGHTEYFWKVVATDNFKATAESKVFSFKTANAVPTKVVGSFPADKAVDVTRDITFKWDESIDDDKDALKYFLYVSTSETLTADDIIGKDIDKNEFTAKLDGHTKYYWQVVTKDANGGRVESDIYSFTIKNTAPIKPVITAPKELIEDAKLVFSFDWNMCTDTDEDEVEYNLYISEDNVFDESEKVSLTELKYELNTLKFNTKYFVKVVANDAFGGITESDVLEYTTMEFKSKIVGDLSLVSPVDAFNGLPAGLSWNNLGLGVKYDVFISKSNAFTDTDKVSSDMLEIEFKSLNLDANTKYYWKVVAKDDYSTAVESSIFSFTTDKFGSFADSRDGKAYKTVLIGDDVWLADNFAFIPYVIHSTEDARKCSVYGVDIDKGATVDDLKNAENYSKYGVMYSWNMLPDVVPTGWHVATDNDWMDVEEANGVDASLLGRTRTYRGDTAEKFKSVEGWDPAGTNALGLNITSCGAWELGDKKLGERAYYWTATEKPGLFGPSMSAWMRAFAFDRTGIYRNYSNKGQRYYIRLVKDKK